MTIIIINAKLQIWNKIANALQVHLKLKDESKK